MQRAEVCFCQLNFYIQKYVVFISDNECALSLLLYPDSSSDQVAPEAPVPPSLAAGFGYGESKWVAENICQKISEATGLASSLIRVGQLSGDTDSGRWNVKEWVPALVKAGKEIGSLPSSNEVTDLWSLTKVCR
jgi:thioester reductase-like protein